MSLLFFLSPSTLVQQKNEIKKMELGGATKQISRSKRHSAVLKRQ